MTEYSNDLLEVLSREAVASALFVKIGPDLRAGNVISITSLHYDHTIPAPFNESYIANNGLYAADPPKLSDTLDKESYKIVIADPAFTLRAPFDNGFFVGAPFKVIGAYVNTSDGYELGAPPGAVYPQTYSVVYEGYVDDVVYSISPDEETLIEIQGASPMGVLDGVRSFITSRVFQAQANPLDSSYNQVTEGSKDIALLWGK